ncbi:MAG TPA: ATP-binding protein [Planctomicrobium sp.]|nr:ATP-binding protein [Planctomicrobium sp.]
MSRLTHQVHFPTIALGILWIIHSLATTMYIPWQNGRQREALGSFLHLIDTALKVQENLSELQAHTDLPPAAQRELKNELLRDLQELRQAPMRPESSALIQEVETQIQNWQAGKESPARTLDFYDLTEKCRLFISAQQRHLLLAIEQRSQTDFDVIIVRAILLVLGVMVGLGLAMWMARSLNQSLAQINVTLRDAAGGTSTELGQIEVSSQGPAEQLTVLETQVQHVVSNLHRVAEELQQTRNDMVRAERLAAVGEVAAGVAHEIRNPLTSVKLLIQRAAERQPVHSLNEEQMQVLLEEISRMENTVQSLLDFARPEIPQNVPCDFSKILDKSLALLEGRLQQQNIQVEISNDEAAKPLLGDPLLIQQVIVNIVINAISFMPSGGPLMLRQWNDELTDSTMLEIQDSGPGIALEVLERVFEPFVTTRCTGSGLGLAISRRVIEHQGGTLTATNAAEGGALFRIQLPLAHNVPVSAGAGEETLRETFHK